ncbi:hypothetical protein ABW19_dt0204790 [Dactylella cylindrospora]|nr:hypothetical protein ABW19_dt0204790 [Dactylella cylindrospora]
MSLSPNRRRIISELIQNKENLPPPLTPRPEPAPTMGIPSYTGFPFGDGTNLQPGGQAEGDDDEDISPFLDADIIQSLHQMSGLRAAKRVSPIYSWNRRRKNGFEGAEALKDTTKQEVENVEEEELDDDVDSDGDGNMFSEPGPSRLRADAGGEKSGYERKPGRSFNVYQDPVSDGPSNSSREVDATEETSDRDVEPRALRSSKINLRAPRPSEEELKADWIAQKSEFAHEYEYQPPPPPKPYKRPNKRVRPFISRYATRLFKHLGLIDEHHLPTGRKAAKVYKWLKREDEKLLHQVALVAPRMNYPHVQEVHAVYQKVRPQVLSYLRENYKESTWLDADDTQRRRLTDVIEDMALPLKHGDELAVIVKKGSSEFFGRSSVSPDNLDEGKDNETDANKSGVFPRSRKGKEPVRTAASALRWYNPFNKLWEEKQVKPTRESTGKLVEEPKRELKAEPKRKPERDPTKLRKNRRPLNESTNMAGPITPERSDIVSWNHSPTPPPKAPVPGVYKHVTNPENPPSAYEEFDRIHYGLRWVTDLGVPSGEEPVNGRYQSRPNIGASVGSPTDAGSGTLGGYLTDGQNVYAMTCHHVVYWGDENVYPINSNRLEGATVISPSLNDLRVSTMALSHEIDNLTHEAIGSTMKGQHWRTQSACVLGYQKIKTHDRCIRARRKGGEKFGEMVASSWRIANTSMGPMLMDQVLIAPKKGTNVFTYLGRDNKYGKRYQLEARGWENLELGDEVLKIGRSTGLTRGQVISLDADVRMCMGTVKPQSQSRSDHPATYYWEIKTGVITNGSGPWFSGPGDSGAWILKCPSWDEMRNWDLRRKFGKKVTDPIAAPVGGMLFAGADSVEGISLTFYNPTNVLRRYLQEQMPGGENLVPGMGTQLEEPEQLPEFWKKQVRWSTEDEDTQHEWKSFVDNKMLGHWKENYESDHLFRDQRWVAGNIDVVEMMRNVWRDKDGVYRVADRKKAVEKRKARKQAKDGKQPPNLVSVVKKPTTAKQDTILEAKGHFQPSTKPSLRVRVDIEKTPRRRGTSEETPDTPTPDRPASTFDTEAATRVAQTPSKSAKGVGAVKGKASDVKRIKPMYRLISPRVGERLATTVEEVTDSSSSDSSSDSDPDSDLVDLV